MSEKKENHRPEIEASGKGLALGTTVAATSLFSVKDENGDTMTNYQFWDAGAGATTGYFTLNGVKQAAGTLIEATPSALTGMTYTAGSVKGSEKLWVRAYDGTAWSEWKKWSVETKETTDATTTIKTNSSPKVSVASSTQTVSGGASLTASTLFSVSDDDGDSAIQYEFWDSGEDETSGYFCLDDAREGAKQVISVSSDELSRLKWKGGSSSTSESAWVRVYDGSEWSDWTEWTMKTSSTGAENHRPEIEASGKGLALGTTVAATSLFSVKDENGDTMTNYQFWDAGAGATTGYFTLNGVKQDAGTLIEATPSALTGMTYTAGSVKGSENLWARAYDGTEWSEWKKWSVETKETTDATTTTKTNSSPKVSVASSTQTVSGGASLTASTLFSVSDDDGDSATQYEFWDSGEDETSGYFCLDDAREGAKQVISVSSDELSRLKWKGGTSSTSESAWVRVYDGQSWSDWTEWTMKTSSTGAENHRPEIEASGKGLALGTTVAATSLFSVKDENGDTMTNYQFWDAGAGATTGYFTLNGVKQAAGALIEATPSALTGMTYTAGSVKGSENLWARAYDGTDWSEWKKWSVETKETSSGASALYHRDDDGLASGRNLFLAG